jgi:hypothetical protein
MQEKLRQRLNELKSEYETGQKMLADYEAKMNELKATLLRISGAIQVLEELLKQDSDENEKDADAEKTMP